MTTPDTGRTARSYESKREITMNRASILRKGVAVIGVMAAMVPLKTSAQDSGESYQNLGPYVGGALGYNQPDDQTFEFSGTSTDPTQPTI